jgi:hypothetical protein
MNESGILLAKSKAEKYLTSSIETLCNVFELDYEETIKGFEVPVAEDHEDAKSYESLRFMVNRLKEIRS